MSSFYERLSSKLNDGLGIPDPPVGAPGKTANFKATGERTNPTQDPSRPTASAAVAAPATPVPAVETIPEGTEPLDIDLFQSEGRVVIFAQMAGVTKESLSVTIDEEGNTVTIEVTQKRPSLPAAASPADGVKEKKEGEEGAEKGRYAKQEIKWRTYYRKVYAPMPFDGGEARAILSRGVLVVVLPAKKPGVGKKLAVKEILDETHPPQPKE